MDSLVKYLSDVKMHAAKERATEAYFAALYLETTRHIDRMCELQRFYDSGFVRNMMLDFGNKFSCAIYFKDSANRLPVPWNDAFRGRGRALTEVQRLSLAINAHINHDLAESLFDLYPNGEIRHLKEDFRKIDEIFDSVGYNVYFKIIDGENWSKKERKTVLRSMKASMWFGSRSRLKIFKMATKYAEAGERKKQRIRQQKDRRAIKYSTKILEPGWLLKRSFLILQRTAAELPAENITRWFGPS